MKLLQLIFFFACLLIVLQNISFDGMTKELMEMEEVETEDETESDLLFHLCNFNRQKVAAPFQKTETAPCLFIILTSPCQEVDTPPPERFHC